MEFDDLILSPEQTRKLIKKLQSKAYNESEAGKAKRAAAIASRKSPYAKGCGPNASRVKSYVRDSKKHPG